MHIARIFRAVEVMGENSRLDDEGLIDALLLEGFTAEEANQLVLFVPSAFARPVLENLGVEHFVETVSIPKKRGGSIEVPLSTVGVYTGALALIRGEVGAHAVPAEHFQSLATRSAEIDAANRALNAGVLLKGGTWGGLAVNGPTADELGFES
jgi:hypothetical protein